MAVNIVSAVTSGHEFDDDVQALLAEPFHAYPDDLPAMLMCMRDTLGASDLVIQQHDMPLYIIKGRNAATALTPDIERICKRVLDELLEKSVMTTENEYRKSLWEQNQQVDFEIELADNSLARIHLYENDDSTPAVAIRVQSVQPPHLENLFKGSDRRLDPIMKNLMMIFGVGNGFNVIGGPVRSGKTNLVHAAYNQINTTPQLSRLHIVMVSDTPEFRHRSQYATIQSQTIGRSAKTYDLAIAGALRLPHQILDCGEFRGNQDTAAASLRASLYGSQVNSTTHTYTLSESRNRYVGMFVGNQQEHMKNVFDSAARGLINLRLVPTKDGDETLAIQYINFIELPSKRSDLDEPGQLEAGLDNTGGIFAKSLEKDLADLASEGIIDEETALKFAISKSTMKNKLTQRVN
jgi:Tfp pilus assembly pilus retraction ATPase PilT